MTEAPQWALDEAARRSGYKNWQRVLDYRHTATCDLIRAHALTIAKHEQRVDETSTIEAPSWVEKRALEEIQKHGWSFQEALYAHIAKHETEPVDPDLVKAEELYSIQYDKTRWGYGKETDLQRDCAIRAIVAAIKWGREQ